MSPVSMSRCEVIALLDGAALHMFGKEARGLALWGRADQHDAAGGTLVEHFGPGDGGDVAVTHAGFGFAQHAMEGGVLNRGGTLEDFDFFGALQRFAIVEEIAFVEESGLAFRGVLSTSPKIRKACCRDSRAPPSWRRGFIQRFHRALGFVMLRIMHSGEFRNGQQFAHAVIAGLRAVECLRRGPAARVRSRSSDRSDRKSPPCDTNRARP